ncbi:DUF5690 family protein [Flexithrix dorotheae]|uniref:DUF5690 family protein n=1 Tax=Flexithrix dorotheae TaxID=70993 RepID=UPI000377846E|nr:DUF5690 family protein [Flexithrix dorotheae]
MAKISNVSISKTDLVLMITAFCTYTGMYAVRKSFLAGQYEEFELWGTFHYKTVLVISQVMGYMISKFIGIKVISELPAQKRFRALLGLVTFGLFMLFIFAYLPIPLKPIALFFNGLPLGMVFGIVLVNLEGRRNSELLVAGLSATFIFSTGFIKTTGIWLMQNFQVNEFLMPFITGALFFPLFLLAAYGLNKTKAPTESDKLLRSERQPMMKEMRISFLKQHGLAYSGLVLIYVVLTVVRDFRDNFIVEFWAELGKSAQPELITLTELPISITVLVISAFGILVLNNRTAFKLGMILTLFSAAIMVIVTFMFEKGLVGSVIWMITSGFSVYLPYILFHCLLFERFIAVLKFKGTVGYLFYIADALGYLASVGIMIFKDTMSFNYSWVNFFSNLNLISGLLIILLSIASVVVMSAQNSKFKPEKISGELI